MRLRHLMLIGTCLVMAACSATAEERHRAHEMDKMDMQVMMETWMKLAQPAEPHAQLAGMAGSWTTKSKEWMEPGKPPIESTGTSEMTMLLGGRFLQQRFDGNMMGRPYNGIGTTAYDNVRQRYVSTWIDTMSTGIFMMEGTAGADGKTITLHGDHQMPGGGKMKHRAVWTIVDGNTQTFEMYGTHGHGKEMKMMEIVYTRQ